MDSPRIYLAINNCFASKRWTRPAEWAQVIKDLGLRHVEASADNECDPLYAGPEYLDDWVRDVQTAQQKTGITVVNLYSGHGTYTTLGLAHPDKRVKARMLNDWLKIMVRTASRLGAGLGFFCHAFSDSVLQNCEQYGKAEEDLYTSLTELTQYAYASGTRSISLEQMYTPHQIPWTLKGADKLLREMFARSNKPLYITIDTGHQTGQRKFLRPGYGRLKEALRRSRAGQIVDGLWLGPRSAYSIFEDIVASPERNEDTHMCRLEKEMDRYAHLFAAYEDGDPYIWLERLACYSPIIHLQQTCGRSSSHLPFTREWMESGIIHADKLLHAIGTAYEREEDAGLPPRCSNIYLTLEIFPATADIPADIIRGLEDSVRYWRTYVPEDGVRLDELPAVKFTTGRF